ncbi:MAG TPA: glucose-6-phosphate isomerase [Salinisphaeraceae bacterium]|nr:glucose-6-phosphate isomerase [Salinisphaeraceae bacterium]
MTSPVSQPAWRDLQNLAQRLAGQPLQQLFAADVERAARFSCADVGLYLDYSRQHVTAEVMAALQQLAMQQSLTARRTALFTGAVVNDSEQQPAWHTALRAPRTVIAEGLTTAVVHNVLAAMRTCVQEVRSGQWQGFTGKTISDVVHIGIGGSELGPRLVYRALAQPGHGPRVHFVANVDPATLDDTLARLDPETTLFVVVSKSFTTAETLANARVARRWLHQAGAGEHALARHFIAVSANRAAVAEFGIRRMFEFGDWVGGRFSLWSAVGLSIALALGMEAFEQLLAGAHAADQHFLHAPAERNLPIILALIGIWNRNFLGLAGHVVVPYAERLAHFTAWLQQLEMESNGKGVARHGAPLQTATVPMVWGSVGTNAQHAYFQALHQAGTMADIDFILPLAQPDALAGERERQRVANCLAQAEALLWGRQQKPGQEVEPARHFAGGRPSTTLLLQRLDAWHLGSLLAVYEHKVFVQGVIWDINSFDQWGVELGKELAGELLQELTAPGSSSHDAATEALLEQVRRGGIN